MKRLTLLCVLTIAAGQVFAPAGQVFAADVVQLLPPAATTLTVYPGQTRALVRETHPVELQQGDSVVSFSWAASNVDPTSAMLAVDNVVVSEAVRAAGQDKAVSWRITSPQASRRQATITYFIDGIKWYPSYRLWLQPDGKTARLAGYLHLTNETGGDLPAALVQVALTGPGALEAATATSAAPVVRGVAEPASIPNGATVVRQLLQIDQVPAATHYLYQADRFNGAVERLLVLNLPEGLAGLPDGAMTLYGPGAEAIPLFSTQLSYQPSQELKVDLGSEPDVVVERKLVNYARSNFETDRFGRLTGSDTTEDYMLTVRNRLDCALTLEFTETVLSTWQLNSPLPPTSTDSSWVQFDLPVAPNEPLEMKYTLIKHSGSRIKK